MIITVKRKSTATIQSGPHTILLSYGTPVACVTEGKAARTSKRWSVTTTRHVNEFLKGSDEIESKPQEFFDSLLEGISK